LKKLGNDVEVKATKKLPPKETTFASSQKSWDWLPTLNERRRDEFIFILAVIYVPIGENFEVFWIIGIERACRLLSVLCICSFVHGHLFSSSFTVAAV
jgi:hypothetical protein